MNSENSFSVVKVSEDTCIRQGDVVRFMVTSDGTTGKQWIKRLKEKGVALNSDAKKILLSPEFEPTSDVVTEIAVYIEEFFSPEEVNYTYYGKNLTPEVACLIRDKFSDQDIKAMGMRYIIVMHEPIILMSNETESDQLLLRLGCDYPQNPGNYIHAEPVDSANACHLVRGRAYMVSQRRL